MQATPRLLDSKRVVSELPDPNLNGEFEEEELQVMAYLAKECLLLDPDSRPTMSEVVQILSTIAPETSNRKHFSRDDFKVYKLNFGFLLTCFLLAILCLNSCLIHLSSVDFTKQINITNYSIRLQHRFLKPVKRLDMLICQCTYTFRFRRNFI